MKDKIYLVAIKCLPQIFNETVRTKLDFKLQTKVEKLIFLNKICINRRISNCEILQTSNLNRTQSGMKKEEYGQMAVFLSM